jgi:membrane-associated phospholipid phosphatase
MGHRASYAPDRRARWSSLLERVRGGPPLVPDRLRRWVLAVTIVTVAFLAGFGFAVRNSSRPVLFDRRVDAFLSRASGIDHRVAIILSQFGDTKVFVPITAVVAIGLILLGDYRAAAGTVGSVAVGVVVVEDVLKPFFSRHHAGFSGETFPSGHTVAVALASAVILLAGTGRPLGRLLVLPLRYLLTTILLVVASAIGVAMVVLRLHYMSDVVAGVPFGFAVTGCTALFLDAVARRWASPSPSPGPSG